MKNKVIKTFNFIYYGSEEELKEILEKIKYERYAYILHDKDTDENGEIKKRHYHVIGSLQQATRIKTFSETIGVKENLIETMKNPKACYEYLTHKNDENKYKYSEEEIKKKGVWSFKECDYSLEQIIEEMIKYISEIEEPTTNSDIYFLNFIRENSNIANFTQRFMVYKSIFRSLWDEIQLTNKRNIRK